MSFSNNSDINPSLFHKYMKIVKEAIDRWDPIDLFPYSPNDEYDIESGRIAEIIHENITEEVLANEIHAVFVNMFGTDVFLKDYNDCLKVAKTIKQGLK